MFIISTSLNNYNNEKQDPQFFCLWPPEKRRHPLNSDRHKNGRQSGVLCRIAERAYDPRSWVAGVWTPKSDGTRGAPTGIRTVGEAALFAASLNGLMTRGAGSPESGHRKATPSVQPPIKKLTP